MRTRPPTRLNTFILLSAALICGYHPPSLIAQTLPVWGRLEPGPHEVGYRVLHELDRSRIWRTAPDSNPPPETARPIRISVWYPADVPSGTPTMTLAEFVRDSAPNEYFAQLNRLLERRFVEIFSGVSQDLYDTLLTLPLAAVKNAAPSAGTYPLVMYSPGGQASFPDNGVLSAYLASHGYVVASVPQLERTLEGVFQSYSRQADVQTRDIEFAAGVMRDFPGVDRRHLAVIGYSLGGSVAQQIAQHNPNVDAIVGLDPSFVYARSIQALGDPQSFDVFDIRIPVLSLQAGNEESRAYYSPVFHDTLRFSDRYIGYVAETVHGDFSEIKPMLIPALAHNEELEPALMHGHRGYTASCRYIVSFLDGVLKNDPMGLEFVTKSSGENGMDAGLIQMDLRTGADVPTEIELAGLMRHEGYQIASDRLRLAQQTYQDLDVVRENAMNRIARQLSAEGELDAAISVFRLNIQVHANSIRAHDGLADAYLSNGDSLMVIRTYEQLIEILPLDTTISQPAKDRIRQNAQLRLRILRPTRPEEAGVSRFPA